jgi:hypothetical protein
MSAQALALTPQGIPLVFQGQFFTTNTGLSTGSAAGSGTFTIPVSTEIPSDYICSVVIQTYNVSGTGQNYPGLSVSVQNSYYTSGGWVFTWAQWNPAAGNTPEDIRCQYIAIFSPSQLISVDA